MRVLVTGGAGFIGSHLVDQLVACRHDVVVLDNLDPQVHGPEARGPGNIEAHVRGSRVEFRPGDVTRAEDVRAALRGVRAVVHLAAAVGVGQSMYEPDYYVRTNDLGTGILLQELVQLRGAVRSLVVASSMSLYGEGACRCPRCGGANGLPRSEERLRARRWEVCCAACGDDLRPEPTPEDKPADLRSIYAATKKHQEDLCVAFGQAYGLTTFALRFFNVFGSRQSLRNPYTGVAAIFLSRLLKGHPPLLFEDGGQTRDFIDVRDVARALRFCVEFDGGGVHVLNIGTGRGLTIAEVARALARRLGSRLEPEALGHHRVGDIRHCVGDVSRAASILGFRADHDFEDGLAPLIDWCRLAPVEDRVETSLIALRNAGLVR